MSIPHHTNATDPGHWDLDPCFTAVPRLGGGWKVERNERGRRSLEHELPEDGDLVLLWMEHYCDFNPFPFSWEFNPEDVTALEPAVNAVRRVREVRRGWENRRLRN
jgi:hypothetical protein